MKKTYIRSVKAQIVAVATLLAFSLAFIVPPQAAAQNNPVQRATTRVLVTGRIANAGGVFNGILKVTHVAVDSATGALSAAGTLS